MFYDGFYKSCHFQKCAKMTRLLYKNFSIAAVHLTLSILNWNQWNFTQVLAMIWYTSSKTFKAITTLSCEISKDVSMVVLCRISFILKWYFEYLNLNWYYWNLTQVLSKICYTCFKNLKVITTLSREILKDVSMVALSRISSILVPFPYIFRRV